MLTRPFLLNILMPEVFGILKLLYLHCVFQGIRFKAISAFVMMTGADIFM